MTTGEAAELGTAYDERLAGLESGDGGAPLGLRHHSQLAEGLPGPRIASATSSPSAVATRTSNRPFVTR